MAKSMIPKLPLYPFVLSAAQRVIEVAKTPDGPVKKLMLFIRPGSISWYVR